MKLKNEQGNYLPLICINNSLDLGLSKFQIIKDILKGLSKYAMESSEYVYLTQLALLCVLLNSAFILLFFLCKKS